MIEDMTVLSDLELCTRIGETSAFVELQNRYLWLVQKKAKEASLQNSEDKDDFVQIGLLALYSAANSYSPDKGASFKTYASICIRNSIYNEIKRTMHHNNHAISSLRFDDCSDEIESSAMSIEEEVELKADFEAVLNQIHISLTEFEKKILAIYLSGCIRSEIPEKYGVSIKAYDNAIQRFRKKLKSQCF